MKVTAIESQQRKALWRAIKVELKRATPVMLRYANLGISNCNY